MGYTEPEFSSLFRYIMVFFFFCSELKNLKCHIILKELKDKNKGEKGIPPATNGFEFVTCANYFWEVLAWVCFSIYVNLIAFYIFTFCGFYIMQIWAQKKHKNMKSMFHDYPKNRKAIIP